MATSAAELKPRPVYSLTPHQIEQKRRCQRCNCQLNSFNQGETCWTCHEKEYDHWLQTADLPEPEDEEEKHDESKVFSA